MTSEQYRRAADGSPPRVWGIRRCSCCSGSRWPVHPHACGEYDQAEYHAPEVDGSPPRVWGIRAQELHQGVGPRFTPTRVGNTQRRTSATSWTTVHPHACGEYHRVPVAGLGRQGFTPTRVGNTPCGRSWRFRPAVHPHACGEYFPRCEVAPEAVRFTPTRVGNTCAPADRSRPAPVHPHACGEYTPRLNPELGRLGSPPRVWGILDRVAAGEQFYRFTPTRVGNTPRCPCRSRHSPVHPHACGEYVHACRLLSARSGSPPRVWGIRLWEPSPGGTGRFTPTRVGNT